MIKQYKEHCGQTENLYLRFYRMSFGIDNTGNNIYQCHKYRKDINREPRNAEHSIFGTEIIYESEFHSLKVFHTGQQIVSSYKKRNLQSKDTELFKAYIGL